MDDLIARLEAATEESCELSWAVAEHLGWAKIWCGQTIYLGPGEWAEKANTDPLSVSPVNLPHNYPAGQDFPHFAESLDAALTLVPDGYDYGFSYSKKDGLEAWVQRPFKDGECFQGYAPDGDASDKTRAKALCIAALRARAAGGKP